MLNKLKSAIFLEIVAFKLIMKNLCNTGCMGIWTQLAAQEDGHFNQKKKKKKHGH